MQKYNCKLHQRSNIILDWSKIGIQSIIYRIKNERHQQWSGNLKRTYPVTKPSRYNGEGHCLITNTTPCLIIKSNGENERLFCIYWQTCRKDFFCSTQQIVYIRPDKRRSSTVHLRLGAPFYSTYEDITHAKGKKPANLQWLLKSLLRIEPKLNEK
jgi:hypothetical protein